MRVEMLRRAGLAIDKNATATQALTELQKAYGGAAVTYATGAAGGAATLPVAPDDTAEVTAGPLSNAWPSAANSSA
jgi:hypothetical protein